MTGGEGAATLMGAGDVEGGGAGVDCLAGVGLDSFLGGAGVLSFLGGGAGVLSFLGGGAGVFSFLGGGAGVLSFLGGGAGVLSFLGGGTGVTSFTSFFGGGGGGGGVVFSLLLGASAIDEALLGWMVEAVRGVSDGGGRVSITGSGGGFGVSEKESDILYL
ncbi:hypothetical protein J437_LFUL003048 [Ladona fulva]|uniref:Uncharacterized protein n=1 Tax=Ladona fulva TaxID=123851 RepID=A0A8K0K1M0_LADFU|nr:hypothetical protein J437_LFUL003048 [Ladona fulva]